MCFEYNLLQPLLTHLKKSKGISVSGSATQLALFFLFWQLNIANHGEV